MLNTLEKLIVGALIQLIEADEKLYYHGEKIMSQLDDLKAAITKDANDTQTLISGVAALVAQLQAQIAALQAAGAPDLTDVIASVTAIDTLVQNATPPAAPVASGVSPAPTPVVPPVVAPDDPVVADHVVPASGV